MSLKNLKIGHKLMLGFGAIIGLMMAMAALAYIHITQLNDNINVMTKDHYQKTVSAHKIKEALNGIARNTRWTLLETKEGYTSDTFADAYKKLSGIVDGIGEQITILDKLSTTPEDRENFQEIAKLYPPFSKQMTEFIDTHKSGKKLEAQAMINGGSLYQSQTAFFKAIDKLNADENKIIEDAGVSSEQLASRSRLLLVILAAMVAAISAAVGIVITRSITRPINIAVGVARSVADGDLTSKITVNSNDETGQLLSALKDMNDNLAKLVGNVRIGADTIATASSEIAAGNLDLSSRTEEQASSLEETASAMEQLTSTVKQNADNSRQANQLAAAASDVAVKGGTVVSQVVGTMDSINQSSKKIVDIISVIDGIAFQTNILALNAAVEAARAGEQGRGFAVVASEVRNLAQRSAAAAKEIKTLIGDSVSKVDAGSKLVAQAGSTMDEVVASVRRVTDIMGEITSASAEQSTGIEEVNRAITQMDTVTQQNAALVEQAAAAAESMQDQAANLARLVGTFRVGNDSAGKLAQKSAAVSATPAKTYVAAPAKKAPAARLNSVTRTAPATVNPVASKEVAAKSDDDWEEF